MPDKPKTVSFGRKSGGISAASFGANRIDYDARRGSAHKRGYTRAWQKASKGRLRKEPLCRVSLLLEGITVGADVVDHFYPHRQLSWLFWTNELWLPMAKRVHDGWKQELEARGEAALDEMAVRLGLTPLYILEPQRVQEWRAAEDQQRGGGSNFSARGRRPAG